MKQEQSSFIIQSRRDKASSLLSSETNNSNDPRKKPDSNSAQASLTATDKLKILFRYTILPCMAALVVLLVIQFIVDEREAFSLDKEKAINEGYILFDDSTIIDPGLAGYDVYINDYWDSGIERIEWKVFDEHNKTILSGSIQCKNEECTIYDYSKTKILTKYATASSYPYNDFTKLQSVFPTTVINVPGTQLANILKDYKVIINLKTSEWVAENDEGEVKLTGRYDVDPGSKKKEAEIKFKGHDARDNAANNMIYATLTQTEFLELVEPFGHDEQDFDKDMLIAK